MFWMWGGIKDSVLMFLYNVHKDINDIKNHLTLKQSSPGYHYHDLEWLNI